MLTGAVSWQAHRDGAVLQGDRLPGPGRPALEVRYSYDAAHYAQLAWLLLAHEWVQTGPGPGQRLDLSWYSSTRAYYHSRQCHCDAIGIVQVRVPHGWRHLPRVGAHDARGPALGVSWDTRI